MDKSKKAVVVSNATKQEFRGEGFDESTYIAPVYDSSVRDFGIEFLLILILPLVVVIIIAIILAIVMFCFREGRWVLFKNTSTKYHCFTSQCIDILKGKNFTGDETSKVLINRNTLVKLLSVTINYISKT